MLERIGIRTEALFSSLLSLFLSAEGISCWDASLFSLISHFLVSVSFVVSCQRLQRLFIHLENPKRCLQLISSVWEALKGYNSYISKTSLW